MRGFRVVGVAALAAAGVEGLKCKARSSAEATCAEVTCGAGYDACANFDLGTAPTDLAAALTYTSHSIAIPLIFETAGTSGCVKKNDADTALYMYMGAVARPATCRIEKVATDCPAADSAAMTTEMETMRAAMEGKATYKWKICTTDNCNTDCTATDVTYTFAESSAARTGGVVASVLVFATFASLIFG